MNENKAQNQAFNQEIAKAAEAKTVINGQEVSVHERMCDPRSF